MLEELQRRNYSSRNHSIVPPARRPVRSIFSSLARSTRSRGDSSVPTVSDSGKKAGVVKLQPDRLCAAIFLCQDFEACVPAAGHSFPTEGATTSPDPQPGEEVARILTAPSHLKSRALLMTIYAAGLRRSEAAHLRVNDIDSARITITVHGKGQKDRVVMLSPVLLEILRQYWRHNQPKQWLFPGENPDYPVNDNDVFTVFHNAVRRAGITKKVSPHSLRQASAYYTTFQSSFSLKTIGLGQVQSAAVYGRSALLRPEPAHLAIVDLFDR